MDTQQYISSGLIEMYVLGLCSEEEKAEIELLRRQHPEIKQAITNYELAVENNLQKYGATPPPSVDEKVLSQIDSFQTPVVDMRTASSIRRFRWSKGIAAAAILLLLASGAINFILYQKLDQQPSSTLPVNDYKVMLKPSITPVAMYGQGIHAICRCTLYWDKQSGKAYVMIH